MVHVLYEITEWTIYIDQVIHVKALCVTVHPNSKKDRHPWASRSPARADFAT